MIQGKGESENYEQSWKVSLILGVARREEKATVVTVF